jgi:peptidyl-prolyl cis-trans isomerase B (cyclophilin B)
VATKRERQRKLAREAHARRMQRQVDRARRARLLSVIAIVAVLVVGVGFAGAAIAGVFSPSKPTAAAGSHTPSATPTAHHTAAPVSPSPSTTAAPSPTATAALVNGKCVYTPSGTAARKVSLPPARPDRKATYVATIRTNRGNIVIDLLNKQAPCTVNSFVSLADQKFYNHTPCHRLTTSIIWVLQCGDPTGTGSGGPGYEFYTENLNSIKTETVSGSTEGLYPAGTVAMARAQPLDSNGSQFFLVYKQSPLPQPGYTPFGTIVSGLSIIQNVAKAGSDNSNGPGDGHPKEKVQIDRVTITKT